MMKVLGVPNCFFSGKRLPIEKIVCDLLNGVPQLQMIQKLLRTGFQSKTGAQNISGDRPGEDPCAMAEGMLCALRTAWDERHKG